MSDSRKITLCDDVTAWINGLVLTQIFTATCKTYADLQHEEASGLRVVVTSGARTIERLTRGSNTEQQLIYITFITPLEGTTPALRQAEIDDMIYLVEQVEDAAATASQADMNPGGDYGLIGFEGQGADKDPYDLEQIQMHHFTDVLTLTFTRG